MSESGLEIVNNAAESYTSKRAARQPRRTGSPPGRHVAEGRGERGYEPMRRVRV